MKSLILLIVGIAIGVLAHNLYVKRETARLTEATAETSSEKSDSTHGATDTRTLGEKAGDTAARIKDDISTKASEWKLTPADIKRDLIEGGKVVREKAGVAGGKIADARIVTVIKAKYVLDRDLSALDINVDSTNGDVVLNGTVASVDHVAKALVLALETDGVVTATSNLIAPF